MRRIIIKKKSHKIIWRTFTIILGLFLLIFFFGAYVFYTNDTDYSQRTFSKNISDLENVDK